MNDTSKCDNPETEHPGFPCNHPASDHPDYIIGEPVDGRGYFAVLDRYSKVRCSPRFETEAEAYEHLEGMVTPAKCIGCGQSFITHGYADVCDECAATGNAQPVEPVTMAPVQPKSAAKPVDPRIGTHTTHGAQEVKPADVAIPLPDRGTVGYLSAGDAAVLASVMEASSNEAVPDSAVFQTLYRSNSFNVSGNQVGVEILNLQTGDTRWMTHSDLSNLAGDVRIRLAAIPTELKPQYVEAASDRYLWQYFDGSL